jgi:hypothetical protein
VQETNETGIASHLVYLSIDYVSETDIRMAVPTDGSGYYRFGNLLLDEDGDGGTYTLSTLVPSGMVASAIGTTNSWLDSNNSSGTVFVATRGVTDVSADSPADTNDNGAATYDFGFYTKPTLVVLVDFRAESRGDDVYVVWATAAEVGTIGFFVERLDPVTGGYVPVHDTIVPGALFSADENQYDVLDPEAVPGGTYTYRLIEIENTGTRNTYGPFTVTVDADNAEFAAWLEQWFGEVSLGDVLELMEADPDGDGMTNLEEFLAGTDPDDILSALRLILAELGEDSLTIEWSSVTGCLYDVELSTNLVEGFECLIESLEATPPANSVTVPAPKGSSVFYRIRLAN